ncbi:riboflavin synthase [Pectinatus cerevisiiphilus]|uniref:Riboflavin synthase n=1 Tax=Pectinatus cerevisiiphilus TaxID=86956 RepID=A0A4R3KDW4_9FIRM|nr:riboflavin synthase [Pectinatus cerevisiiphilus]TCS81368.1 riboflavin synthase alpha chain [Pectinatus cerevisiiphilus]
MFTGIIEEVGHIAAIKNGTASVRLTIAAEKVLRDVNIGDSIAVNGTCLTVTQYTDKSFSADVMPESVRKTSLSELKTGSLVNLERALQVGARLGGHIVSGHIDGTGKLISKKPEDNAIIVAISAAKDILKYIVKKGSVTVDGISLTVVDVDSSKFSVSLIPHTASITTIGQKSTGASVNIETDILGKYVEKLLFLRETEGTPQPSGIDINFLSKNGF